MTELLLKKDGGEWHRAYFSTSGSGFKLVRENPYFTQSESYTLDVVLPADIMQNRQLLGSLHRMDCTKQPPAYKCRLMVDNVLMLDGSAKITQVTEREIKVQLFGGGSEVRFLSGNNEDYIDTLPLGTRSTVDDLRVYSDISTGLPFSRSLIYNETAEEFVDPICCCHPQLVGVMRLVLAHYGFTMTDCFLDEEPWTNIYVASALHTLDIAHKLPHWTVRDFMQEFSQFFNATPVIDQVRKTVEFVSNKDFYGPSAKVHVLDPIDEYTAELTADDSLTLLANSNIAFDLSGSPSHDYDCLTDEQRKGLPRLSFEDGAALREAYDSMEETKRRKYVFSAPGSDCVSWMYTDENGGEQREYRVSIDRMKPLDRDSGKTTSLKIVPVAIGHELVTSTGAGKFRMYHGVPTVESPTRDEAPSPWTDDEGNVEFPDVQDVIQGTESIDKPEKEDRMQVMFDDGKTFPRAYSPMREYSLGFIDFGYKGDSEKLNNPWSLSLYPTSQGFAHCLGDLHQNGFSFNEHAKCTFRFIAEAMPDPTRVYIIRGKRYGCEKIEANVTAEGLDRLMTGYFYEIL